MKSKRCGVVQEGFLDEKAITNDSLCTNDTKLILKWREGGVLWVDLGRKAAGTWQRHGQKQGWMDDDDTFWDGELYSGRVKEADINREAEPPPKHLCCPIQFPKFFPPCYLKPSLSDAETTAQREAQSHSLEIMPRTFCFHLPRGRFLVSWLPWPGVEARTMGGEHLLPGAPPPQSPAQSWLCCVSSWASFFPL